jgi:hypothetical protein
MSEDELFVTVVAAVVAGRAWWTLCAPALTLHRLGASRTVRLQVLWILPAVLALLFSFLRRYADAQVRVSPLYQFFYLLMGAAWIGTFAAGLAWLGVSLRDDVLERRNPAARTAWMAAVFAITFCFAGSNIGDGPGWWVVVFCAALATGALFLLWALLAAGTGLRERVIVERDRTAGRRLAGFFLAAGLILGRAAAGDWISVAATWTDFGRAGWPALLLLAFAFVIERILAVMAREEPRGIPGTGAPIAMAYLAFAALVLSGLGPW